MLLRLEQRHHVRERRIQRPLLLRRLPSRAFAAPKRPTGPPSRQSPAGPIKLEASSRMVVLFRIAERKVDRIRVFSEDCELDAGGRPVIWLDGVRPADSVALLETLAVLEPDRRNNGPMDGAISAIALHAESTADAALDRLVATTAARSGAPQGDVLAWKHTWRTWPRHASAGVEGRSEHRSSEERGLRRLPKPRVRSRSTRSPIWRATTLNRG